MTAAWFLGAQHSVAQSDEEVRSTVEPIRNDNETAEATEAPDWNEFDSDESGELVGLSPRVTGGHTVDTQRFIPSWLWNASQNHQKRINDQVASSGTAAAREEAGQQGHGSMQYEESIEPVIREGGTYGNDYFVASPGQLQDGAGAYMTAQVDDHWANIAAHSDAIASSRQAFQGTQWGNFLAGY